MRSRVVHFLVLLAIEFVNAAPLQRAERMGRLADPRTEAPTLQGAPRTPKPEPEITRRLTGRGVEKTVRGGEK